ncbi:hypothetical protein SAMN04487895_101686 [Paenibacillus sophorae]|uniref:Uncharacterized protein n=1 Tax=Paenibacillus sophorae TaxID=1333845 RepID=A0A1H8GYH2_9BACL|nr:hypothetical protein [Paenibacillus sophorae]QWU14380.1 hypothetical protein KP014_20960 [Paenibacillus sophorae]SEN48925.1 hypothetical protein SAMN04487895_101686 [Paenibacillus sophorae]
MDEELKMKLTDLLHDTAFYIMGIETVTGRDSGIINRLSDMINKMYTNNDEARPHES